MGWYNFRVPTPFHHLHLAEEILSYAGLPEKIRQFLQTSRCEFLFGNTAPDVQVVSGQSRQQTHFFNLPIGAGDPPAWECMLAGHPQLAELQRYSAPQIAFITGYLCHLQADWLWVKDIFTPVFGPYCSWGTFRERLYLHNVLRAYLDVCSLAGLPPGMDECLRRVKPGGWLPFVKSYHLVEWRDLLISQLYPGAVTQTVEVFASRQGISVLEFQALLSSDSRMQEEVFKHLSLQKVHRYHQRVLEENIQLMSGYLVDIPQDVVSPAKRNVLQGVQPLN